MNILILGHDGAGKDTVAEALAEQFGLSYTRTSLIAAEQIIMKTKAAQEKYQTYYDCYEDRDKNREVWAKLISEYNTPDGSALAKLVLQSNDIYVGIRKRREFVACEQNKLFQIKVWVKHPEATQSAVLEMTEKDCDIVYNNNINCKEDKDKFNRSIKRLYASIRQKLNTPSSQEEKDLLAALNEPLNSNKAIKEVDVENLNNAEDSSEY